MSSIFGGFEELVYTSDNPTGTATPFGIATRLNPILDPSNISVRGTGKRGLYDILLGMRQPQFTMDILPSDIDFIADYQNGQTEIPYLHYRYTPTSVGLTFTNAVFNRVSVEARHNEAITATIEVWADGMTTLKPMSPWSTHAVTPYRWLYSKLSMGPLPAAPVEETQWWSWRYEVNNNFQRLGNTSTGATRDIKARHRDVNGLIVKDLENFDEWTNLMVEEAKFNITIEVNGSGSPGSGSWKTLLDQDACRWGRLEAPVGPEDLQAKRFPFLAIDLT